MPEKAGRRKAWGARSGARQELLRRNDRMRKEFVSGAAIGELSERYGLSVDSIKKIVYTH